MIVNRLLNPRNNVLIWRFILLVSVCFLFCSHVYGSKLIDDRFFLEADSINYIDKDVYASGNVIAKFNDYDVSMDQFEYHYEKRLFKFNKNVSIQRGGTLIKADLVTYNLTTLQGAAIHVTASIDNVIVKGEKVHLLEDKIQIFDAISTTCIYPDLHYHIHAGTIELYPQYNYFVAQDTVFYFYGIPLMYLPTYIQASEPYGILGTNAPLPVAGSNRVEGWFIKQKLSYFLNPGSSGSVDFGYSEKLQWFGQLSHGFTLGDVQGIQFRAKYYQQRDWSGGISYYYNFRARPNQTETRSTLLENLFTSFLPEKNQDLGLLTVDYQTGIIENNYWLDFIPLINYQIHEFNLPFMELRTKMDANWGTIKEYDDLMNFLVSERFNFNGQLSKSLNPIDSTFIDLALNYYGFWYQKGSSWHRLFGDVHVHIKSLFLKPRITYSKLFIHDGQSIFNFDSENKILSDEIGLHLQLKLSDFELAYEIKYNLDTWNPRLINADIKFGPDCWNLNLKVRFIHNDVLFGFSLN